MKSSLDFDFIFRRKKKGEDLKTKRKVEDLKTIFVQTKQKEKPPEEITKAVGSLGLLDLVKCLH